MQIVFVDTTLTTPPTGGGQTFLVSAAEAFAQRGFKVSVVTQKGADDSIIEALRKVHAEVIDNLWSVFDLPDTRAEKLANWVNNQNPSVYIVSISPDCGWLALPLLTLKTATVSIAHNDVAAFFAPVAHYHALLDCAVAVSAEIHRKLIADCGMPPERTRQIPYGIDPFSEAELSRRQKLRMSGGTLRIGYVGRIEQSQKRVMDFVPLVIELARRGVDFTIDFVGDGSERLLLEEQLRQQAPMVSVKFWGWMSSSEVRSRLAELDVFVLMSDFEGLPVALLESMGCGVAPVVSRIGSGNTEVVNDGENGFIVDPGDIDSFADRLQKLASDPNLLQSLATKAWETSMDYSIERMVERYLDLFAELTDLSFSRAHRRNAPHPYPVMESCVSPFPKWVRKLKLRFSQ